MNARRKSPPPSFSATVLLVAAAGLLVAPQLSAANAKQRWERLKLIRQEKIELILPQVMRENGIDMWITMIREANYGSFWIDFGQGYTADYGFYVFTDRGDRIERAALGIDGYKIENAGIYEIFAPAGSLGEFVKERDPKSIAINTSRAIGPADDLSHEGYRMIVELIGTRYEKRLVSAEKLVSDFRSRRTASEIAAFAEVGEISREIAERGLSNEVIAPDKTRLEDVAWWMEDQLLDRGFDSSFGMPSVYVTGPAGIEDLSNRRIIRRGDFLIIDWGVGYLNFFNDMKRQAYVLREGENEAPAGLRHAYERARQARTIIKGALRAGIPAQQAEEEAYAALTAAGFQRIGFNQPTDDPASTDVVLGCHSVGNTGHGIGPSVAFFNPKRRGFTLRESNFLSIELFAYSAVPEWGGAKVRIPLEDDAVVTARGVEWLYPPAEGILLIE